jgi:metal-sulfur cluster biosynthetic enzyme
MSTTLQERVAKTLSQIRNTRTGADVYSTQQVRDIGVTTDGRVHLTLLLTKDDDPALARTVRQEIEKIDGVLDVQLEVKPVKLPDAPKPGRAPLPVMTRLRPHRRDPPRRRRRSIPTSARSSRCRRGRAGSVSRPSR